MTDYADLRKRLDAIADSDNAKAILLVRMNEPTGEADWTPFKQPSVSVADMFREASAAIAALVLELHGRPTIEEWSAEIDRVRDHWKGKVAALVLELEEEKQISMNVVIAEQDSTAHYAEKAQVAEAALSDLQREVREAIEPFATYAETAVDENGWVSGCGWDRMSDWLGPTDFRTLAALHARLSPPPSVEDETP